MRKHIYDDDWKYTTALQYGKFSVRCAFRRFHVGGWERVPTDGSVILVSNHTGALMDPLVMLRAEGHKVVFMARGDIFKKPFVARILSFLRILPIYRVRDGFDAVRDKNTDSMEQAVDTIIHRVPLCLYPEGTHRAKHSLLRLNKGIFHMAIEADRRIGGQWPVYIVPVGIEYADYYRYHTDLELEVGEPIDISALIREHADLTEPQLINLMRDRLTEGMSATITYLPDDEDYDAMWELTKVRTAQSAPLSGRERRILNRRHIERLLRLRSEHPEEFARLREAALKFKAERERRHISVYSTAPRSRVALFFGTLLTLIAAPLALLCLLMSWPVIVLAERIAYGIKDRVFRGTGRFGVFFFGMPLIAIVWALVAGFTLHSVWWALLAAVIGMIAVPFCYNYVERVRRQYSHWRMSKRLRHRVGELVDPDALVK